jgi:hypothetical protein
MPLDEELQAEVELSRKSAAQLLESLSSKLRITKLRIAPTGRNAAQFVRNHPFPGLPRRMRPFVSSTAIVGIAAVVIAGFLLARTVRKNSLYRTGRG